MYQNVAKCNMYQGWCQDCIKETGGCPTGMKLEKEYQENKCKETNDKITVSYDEKFLYEYWDDDNDHYDYEEMEVDAKETAEDLLTLDIEDKLNKIHRRSEFLMPAGWQIEYIYH